MRRKKSFADEKLFQVYKKYVNKKKSLTRKEKMTLITSFFFSPCISIYLPDNEETDPVFWKALPGPHEVHLGLQQVQVLHVGVGLQNLLTDLQVFNDQEN